MYINLDLVEKINDRALFRMLTYLFEGERSKSDNYLYFDLSTVVKGNELLQKIVIYDNENNILDDSEFRDSEPFSIRIIIEKSDEKVLIYEKNSKKLE